MHIMNKKDVERPIQNPSGELLYELIGASATSGGAEKHSVAVVILPPGKSSDRHHHIVSEETYFILRGRARMVVDDHAFQMTPGDACLIQPPERHQIFNSGDEDLEFVAVCAPAWVPEDSVFA